MCVQTVCTIRLIVELVDCHSSVRFSVRLIKLFYNFIWMIADDCRFSLLLNYWPITSTNCSNRTATCLCLFDIISIQLIGPLFAECPCLEITRTVEI